MQYCPIKQQRILRSRQYLPISEACKGKRKRLNSVVLFVLQFCYLSLMPYLECMIYFRWKNHRSILYSCCCYFSSNLLPRHHIVTHHFSLIISCCSIVDVVAAVSSFLLRLNPPFHSTPTPPPPPPSTRQAYKMMAQKLTAFFHQDQLLWSRFFS